MTQQVTALQQFALQKREQLLALLFANSVPRIGSYLAIAKAIAEAGHLAALVIPNGVKLEPDELAGYEDVKLFSSAGKELHTLVGIDAFFSSELVSVVPATAVTVCIPHSIPDTGLDSTQLTRNTARFIEWNPTVIRTFDYVVSAVRQQGSELTPDNYEFIQEIYPAAFLERRRPHLDIVPGGYPKLDYSTRILASNAPLDTLLYSPTATHVQVGHARRDAASILTTLLSEFPAMRVVYRPYPSPADIAHGRELAASFAGYPMFAFDDTTTGIASQQRSAMIVTDSSSSALTFSMATQRPVAFVDLGEVSGRETSERIPFGYRVASLPALVAAIQEGLRQASDWSARIPEEANKFIYNPGHAAQYLASHLERFVRRESHPDWLSVERRPMPMYNPADLRVRLEKLRALGRRRKTPQVEKMVSEIEKYLRKT